MATKEELLKKAEAQGVTVSDKNTVAEIKEALKGNNDEAKQADTADNSAETAPDSRKEEEVTVNENENQEAVNGTTDEDSEGEVSNKDSIPQNGITEIETTEPDNEIAKRADAARTENEIKFADEANPNQKGRTKGAANAEEDIDGNQRTGGKSYAVASDDTGADLDQSEGAGNAPRSSSDSNEAYRVDTDPEAQRSFLHGDTNAGEWSVEDQQELEDRLSDDANNIKARVSISSGDYVKVKFYRNNLVFGIYKSKNFDEAKAEEFLNDLKDQQGL